jgi:hypothetical protein
VGDFRYVRIWGQGIHEYIHDDHLIGDTDILIQSRNQLTYPKRRGAPYYEVGDYILTRSMRDTLAAHEFREFSDRLDGDVTIGSFISSFLDLYEIKVCMRIEAITGAGDSASVTLRPYLIISPTELVRIHGKRGNGDRVLRGSAFIQMFRDVYRANAGLIWEPIGRIVLIGATLPFGGGARAAAGRLFAPLMRRLGRRATRQLFRLGGRRLARLILSKLARKTAVFTLTVTRDTVIKVVRRYFAEIQANQLRNRVNPDFVRSMNLDLMIRESLRDAVADNLVGEITKSLQELVPGGVSPEDLMPPSIRENVTRFITQNLLTTVLSPMTNLLKSAILSVEFVPSPRDYETRLHREFENRFTQEFSAARLGSMFGSIVNRMMASPEIFS